MYKNPVLAGFFGFRSFKGLFELIAPYFNMLNIVKSNYYRRI